MASKFLAPVCLLGLFLFCAGVPLEIEDDLFEDTALVLLQGEVELRKAAVKAKSVVAFDEEEEGSYASEICSNCQEPASSKISLPSVEEKVVLAAKAAEPAVVPEVVTDAPKPTSYVGMCLQAAALVLIMNVLRRSAESKSSSETASAKAPLISAPVKESPSFLAAALAGDEAAFQAQCKTRSQASQADTWGCTALHYAAKGGSAPIVKRLVDLGAWLEALDVWDETPLHIAARAGHVEVCEALLAAGAQVNALNAEEHTPLVVAGRADKGAVCTLLVGCGAGVAGLEEEKVPRIVAGLLQQTA